MFRAKTGKISNWVAFALFTYLFLFATFHTYLSEAGTEYTNLGMNRLPNPFRSGQNNTHRSTPRSNSTPAFLLMTRPPEGTNSVPSPVETGDFISFSNVDNSNSSSNDNSWTSNQGSMRPYNRHGRHSNSDPWFAHPYQHSPGGGGRMPSPRGRNGQNQNAGFSSTPRPGGWSNSFRSRYSTPRGNMNATPRGNFNSGRHRDHFQDRGYSRSFHNTPRPNGSGRGGYDRSRGRGPISSIPIENFVKDSMVKDPWSGLCDEVDNITVESKIKSGFGSLDDSEIIIDSDLSTTAVENSYGDIVSDTEVDSSPVHDTGSESPNIATSSTSEKDTGSDSGSDT